MANTKDLGTKSVKRVVYTAARSGTIRKLALKKAVGEIYKNFILKESDHYLLKEQEDKFYMASALFHSIDRAMSTNISPQCRDALLNIVVDKILAGGDPEPKEKFLAEFGVYPRIT